MQQLRGQWHDGGRAPSLRNRQRLQTAPSISFDERPLTVVEVEASLMTITLPDDNIFGLPAGSTGLSVAHGWVAQVNPPPPGTHTVRIDTGTSSITTTIVVRPG